MKRLRLSLRLGLATLAAIPLVSCAPVHVDSYVGRNVDLRQYRTYAWAAADSFSTGDPRLDNNTFFIERLQRAVDDELQRKGFEVTTAGQSDLVVHYHARIEQRLDSSDFQYPESQCQSGECRPFIYDAGTLLIDVVDRRSNQLLWRGWVERGLGGTIDDQARMEAAVDDAVKRIMARFPL